MRQRKQLKLKYQAQQWKNRKQWKITKKKISKISQENESLLTVS